ncbi:MAG: glycoside hydrolase family 127 protein [Clostridia bacterium]|nr:glycoside hydrolase family 127 protein [Clostridia bacterium]
MKQNKRFGAVLSALLCVPLTLGIMAGCKNDDGGKTMKQSTVENSAPVTYTGLDEVTLTDAYAVNAMEKEREYLLDTLDADKLLFWFHKNAGLTPLATSSYGGEWEGALIGGHILGHYLSALAQGYANANTPENDKARFLTKIEHVVNELKRCQDNAVAAGAKAGFIWGASTASGATTIESQFDEVEKNGNGFVGGKVWVPWYTMHKILQGVMDAYTYTGNETAKTVAVSLGDWVYNRVSTWSSAKKETVLKAEYGGMNDSLYSLYVITGEDKYAVAAHQFDEETLFQKVLNAQPDYLDGLHANTTIPKIIGALNRYITCNGKTINGEEVDASEYLTVAEEFWEYVIDHHTYVTGGNSEWEHFGRDDVLNRERTNCNCETCNTYNMLKLSRMLFTITQDKQYLDFYENTYYNAIWSSQNPETGMTTYFQPMATGYFKVYSSAENHFWCCTGSGMESFTKLNDSIYYEAGNAVYVSLYVGSTYKSDTVSLTQTADLENSDTVKFHVDSGSTVLRLRKPAWTKSFSVTVNDKTVEIGNNASFVSVDVKKGDDITINMEKTVVAYDLPDGEDVLAFKYGPFVLSAELGSENMSKSSTGVNVSIPEKAIGNKTYSVGADDLEAFKSNIGEYLKKSANNKFTLQCNNGTLTYSYHFRQYQQRYGIYFKFTTEEIEEEIAPFTWQTQDTVQPGYGQYENDSLHNLQETNTVGAQNVPVLGTTRAANAGGSFTYRMIVDKTKQNRLVVSFAKADNNKSILIKSGSTTLYGKTLNYDGQSDMYSVEIALPDTLVQSATEYDHNGKTVNVLSITFSSNDSAASARVCSYIYSQYLENNTAYFVDCGDFNTSTVNSGDVLGKYISFTDQAYGADAKTGKMWGIVDGYNKTWSGNNPSGVYTNSTWAYEFVTGDGVDKTVSNRYTKNQFESSIARKLGYKFELENGTYEVRMYFADPWSCSKNPNVSANGVSKITNGAVNEEIFFKVTITNGELTLDITSSDKCINLCYIQIIFA